MGPFYTAEEEDLDNQANISAIPAGSYVCKRARYERGGYDTFEVTGVPGRSKILFHVINTEEETEGCIGIGMSFGVLEVLDEDTGKKTWKTAILRSRDAFDRFMEHFDGTFEFILHIVDYEWDF